MATDILQSKDHINHDNELCKEYAGIDCKDNYDVLAVDNLSIRIKNQADLTGDIDNYEVLAIDRLPFSISTKDLADRLPSSISTKDLANQVDDEDTIQEPADNTLNEDLNQTNFDDVIRQDNAISKKRLVGYIIGIVCFFIATALLIISLWYTQLKSGIEIHVDTIGSGNSTDLITMAYTGTYENVTDTDNIVTKVDTVSAIRQAVSDKPDVHVIKLDTVSAIRKAVSDKLGVNLNKVDTVSVIKNTVSDKPDVNVTKVDTFSVFKQVVSDKQKYAKTRKMYSALFKAKFDFKNKFNISCMKMLLVKDKIWCAFGLNFHFYNIDSMIGEKVQFPIENVYVNGLAHEHIGHIILASGKGLLVMLESGEYVGQIEVGRFGAVCSLKKKLYATYHKSRIVLVYKRQKDNWIRADRKVMREKQIQSLLCNGNHLYVCSRMIVKVYDNMMQRISTISMAHFDKGSLTFCGVDGEGRFLLVNKQGIFIGNEKEKWYKMNIALEDRDFRQLRYVIQDWFNGLIWVATAYGTMYNFETIM